jgi:hypothetical protein
VRREWKVRDARSYSLSAKYRQYIGSLSATPWDEEKNEGVGPAQERGSRLWADHLGGAVHYRAGGFQNLLIWGDNRRNPQLKEFWIRFILQFQYF